MTPMLKESYKDIGDIRGYRGNFKGDEKKPRVWYYYEVEVTKRIANNQIIIGFAQKESAEITDCVGNERWSDIKPGDCNGTVGFDINSGKLSISGGSKVADRFGGGNQKAAGTREHLSSEEAGRADRGRTGRVRDRRREVRRRLLRYRLQRRKG
jgi:hypothetical protein